MRFSKKFLLILSILLLVVFSFGCGGDKEKVDDGKIKIGLVFDVGGRGDKSFNDAAYAGLERAKQELGIEYEYIEPPSSGGGDREAGLRQLAVKGFPLVFGIGFMFTNDINSVAKEFTDTYFACVDYTVNPDIPIPDNVAALQFKEHEGSFLVGAMAGLISKTKKVGFIGGMDIPLIHKFEQGYITGVKTACPECEVLVGYAGVTGEAFKNPGKGKELALSQYNSGADIIFHAAGSTGLGLFEAARETDNLAIGVDSDQYYEAPGYILTSMVKRVDNAVYEVIDELVKGKFTPGLKEFGLEVDGVGYVYDENNKDLIPQEVVDKLEEYKAKIVAGEIVVPFERSN